MEYDAIINFFTVLVTIGTSIGAVYSAWRWALGPIYRAIKNLAVAAESIPSIEKELKNIKEELRPNGGKSLRDVINRIERNLLIEKHARRAMSMAMDIGIFETDGEGKCVWINQYYGRLTGLTTNQAKGYGWVNGVSEQDRERVIEEWRDSVEQNRSFHMIYDMLNMQTNKVTKVRCDSFPICNDNGEVVGHVGIITVLPTDL